MEYIWNGQEGRYFQEPKMNHWTDAQKEAAHDLSRANRLLKVLKDSKESLITKQNALQNLTDLSKGQTSVARHAFCFLPQAKKLVETAEALEKLESSAMAFT